ncbi:MAG: metallophosphoesterase, partial [Oscillospiraceae bacterium]|nr:metallophosphoesterase [Oscillospiraceae bacterium]
KKPYFVVTTEDIADGDVLRIEEKRFLKFHKFAKYLNNDLSGAQLIGCDLSDVNLEEDLSGIDFKGAYVLRDNIDNYSNAIPVDAVIKKEYKKPYFVVTTEYIADGDVIKVDERRFLKFEQFAKYLNNDLSGAQLIGCDLSNVNLELYCLENAVIAYNPNEMIERIQSTSERIEIPESTELTIAHDDRFSVSDFNLFYISDLHLDTKISICCRTDDEIEKYLRKKIRQIQKSISQAEDSRYRSLLIVLGDISCDFELNKLFLQKLRHTCGNLLLILGNHDLWWDDYRKQINRYEEFCSEEGIVFLQNSLCVFKSGLFDNLYGTTYNANFIEDAPAEELKNIIQNSRLIIFGGVGFAGLNNRFNASEGNIYRGAISRKEEIKESKYFEQLYAKIDEALGDKEIIIATHNPMHDWSNKQRNPNWIYLNGHTHHNNYVDNDVAHVFADNQIGYEDKRFILKSVPISGQYDTFENYDDGIYEITKRQYNEFNKGKRIRGHMDFADTVIMIKKNDYYLFMCKNKSSFSILNGGRRTKCSHDPEYCYDHLEELVNIVERPLKDYLEYQSEISNQVRSFGGSGSIHGCIVDIDYFTHIFVNPLDRSLHPYYAEDIYHKIVYPNVAGMLQNHCPSLYPKYEKKYLKGSGQDQEKSMSTLSNQGLVNLDTSIYDASRFFSAAQYLSKSKVLRFWLDENAISFTYLLMDSKQSLPETISDDFADVVDKN